MNLGEAIERGVRRRAPRRITVYRQVKDLIKTYGERDTAQRLGVTVRTLRAWVHPDRRRRRNPRKANRDRISAEHQRNARDVRQATAPRRRMKRLSSKGMRVEIRGAVGPSLQGKDYSRPNRGILADLPPEAAENIMNAYFEEGPEAAAEALKEALSEWYLPAEDWQLDDLTEFRFTEAGRFGDDF